MTQRLDGGTATQLRKAGITLSPPWWTTKALLTGQRRDVLRGVHERFADAGAQVITANTFRCNLRALRSAGLDAAGLGWMVHAAVGVALAARNETGVRDMRIAGSMAPVDDCYRPDKVPPDDELRCEHAWLATELCRAGVDMVLVETMNSRREAVIAVEAVRAVGLPAWVSFVCDERARLLSGESLAGAARAVTASGAEVVLVNCTPPTWTEHALRVLTDAGTDRIGAYPNVEDRTGVPQWTHVDRDLPTQLDPAAFADLLARWRDEFEPAVLGGCCGTTPDHIVAMTKRIG